MKAIVLNWKSLKCMIGEAIVFFGRSPVYVISRLKSEQGCVVDKYLQLLYNVAWIDNHYVLARKHFYSETIWSKFKGNIRYGLNCLIWQVLEGSAILSRHDQFFSSVPPYFMIRKIDEAADPTPKYHTLGLLRNDRVKNFQDTLRSWNLSFCA